MDFVLKECKKICILKAETKVIDNFAINKLKKIIGRIKKYKKIALDLSTIEEVKTNKITDFLNMKNICAFNLNPFVMAQISLLNQKNFPSLYLSERDFIEDKRILVRRRFRVV